MGCRGGCREKQTCPNDGDVAEVSIRTRASNDCGEIKMNIARIKRLGTPVLCVMLFFAGLLCGQENTVQKSMDNDAQVLDRVGKTLDWLSQLADLRYRMVQEAQHGWDACSEHKDDSTYEQRFNAMVVKHNALLKARP